MGPRGVGAWRLFDRLRRPYQNRHHHEAEADNNNDGYHCDFHSILLPPRRHRVLVPQYEQLQVGALMLAAGAQAMEPLGPPAQTRGGRCRLSASASFLQNLIERSEERSRRSTG
jgi:hypothetical protein